VNGEALALFLAAPFAQALLLIVVAASPALRDLFNIALSAVTAVLAWRLVMLTANGQAPSLFVSTPLPGADFAFRAEPLGLIVAATLATLGALNAIYATGYLRAMETKAPARLMAFVALSLGCAIAAASARNLFTFFVCYVALIVVSCPPIAHGGARAAAGRYLAILLSAAILLLFPAIVWTYAAAGGLDFRLGGLLPQSMAPMEASALLLLFAFGFAATALFPLHRWVADAVEAPTPAAGLIHGVTVSAIGGLGILKVSYFVFGPTMAQARDGAMVLLALSLAGAVAASLVALSKQDIKQRLAYSTMAQAGLVTASAMIALPAAAFAGAFAIVAHALSKTSMFFTAGALEAATGRTRTDELAGLGRRMPWAFAAFAFASLSLAGAPPLAGAWSLMWLIAGAGQAGLLWAAGLALLAALLSFAAFGPLAARALFGQAPAHPFDRPDAASAFVIAPTAISALVTLLVLFVVDAFALFLGPGLSP
jgi:multicomponent Na+:H+ antiporter subunit D